MSSLVYLHRLKSKLQPQARGIRCTAHRIFLAALILSAKYLNDSSPKNKHWASYTNMATDYYHFGFNRQEVNTMEKQLLFLLEWDLRVSEADLYRELDYFLSPLRRKISDRHARKMAEREDKRRQEELHEAARRYPSPPRSRYGASMHSRSASGDSMGAPPIWPTAAMLALTTLMTMTTRLVLARLNTTAPGQLRLSSRDCYGLRRGQDPRPRIWYASL
uniref:Cyclin N-terminal domain-containing protein n=1 Tax=Bionectria ochroleuca TaxID=29856 RepID=A0A8H7TRV7_BIOOC